MGEEREPEAEVSVRDSEPAVDAVRHQAINTEPIDHLCGRLASDPTVTKFLLAFTRWEYALKASHGSDYVEYDERRKRLSIHWKRWAKAYQKAWERERPADMEEWEIVQSPPQFQCKVGSHLEPRETPRTLNTDLESVARLLYAVRNNLFHGGKWALRDAARDRDESLLKECIAIIVVFLNVDPELRELFYDVGPMDSR